MPTEPTEPPEPLTFLTHEYLPVVGGAGTVVHRLALAFAGLGHRVRVLAAGRGAGTEPDASPDAPEVTYMGHAGRQDILRRLALVRFLRRREPVPDERWVLAEPAVVRAALDFPAFGLAPAKAPVVILHGTEILRLTGTPRQRRRFRRLLEGAAVVHLLSRANLDLLLGRLPGLRANTVVAPGAPLRFPSEPADPAREGGRQVDLLTVGRVHPRKGQLDVVRALRRLPPALRADIRYRVVGPLTRPSYARRITREAAHCDFPVLLEGALSDSRLEEAYRKAHLFVLASRRHGKSLEGFGLVYLDASAHALPVVAARTGGVAEAVHDGETGILVEEGDEGALAAALENLIRHPGERRRLGGNGRVFAASLSWEATARRIRAAVPPILPKGGFGH